MGSPLNGNSHDCEETERQHNGIKAVFKSYRSAALKKIAQRELFIESLPAAHQSYLRNYRKFFSEARRCVEANDALIGMIVTKGDNIFPDVVQVPAEPNAYGNADPNGDLYNNTILEDINDNKVETVFKQLVRDWSSEGAAEREQSYKPIIDEILKQFPPDQCDPSVFSVLVPGAGAARMAWEIARLGYQCQGNDNSMYMLLASNFIINWCHQVQTEKFAVHPWLHNYTNNVSCADQLRAARIPDVDPSTITQSTFTMAAGDFLKVYTHHNEWSCVATCFFMDCFSNMITFIENVYNILQPGGVWINLGPLLYHRDKEDSLEPPYDILMEIVKEVGFVVEKEQLGVKAKYTQNPQSMVQREYECAFFVCRKPVHRTDGHDGDQ